MLHKTLDAYAHTSTSEWNGLDKIRLVVVHDTHGELVEQEISLDDVGGDEKLVGGTFGGVLVDRFIGCWVKHNC